MTPLLYALLDTMLLVLATLRLSRLVTGDTLGQWLILSRAWRWANRYKPDSTRPGVFVQHPDGPSPQRLKLASGLVCPFCIGYWCGAALLVVSYFTGPLGDEPVWWRLLVGSLALNYLVGHTASLMGDTDPNSPL